MTKLENILSRVGDLSFKRRVIKIIDYLKVLDSDLVLDAGCGECFYPMVLSRLYKCKIVGVDSDNHILDLGRRWVSNNAQVLIRQEDLLHLNFTDNYFDKLICSEVLEHIDNDEGAARELYRVIKPGGIAVITVPNANFPFWWDPLNKIRTSLGLRHFDAKNEFLGGMWSYDHKRLYTVKEIRELLEKAGFKIEKIEVLTHYSLPFNHLILSLGKNFYTKLPVSEDVKKSMEKFEWQQEGKKSLVRRVIDLGFSILKWVDKFNDKDFLENVSSVNISIKARK